MNDLISRQAAIDALKEHRALYCDNTPDAFSKLSHAEKSRVDELDTAIATLVNLPPIQPEIVRCKDCKYWHSGSCEYPEHVVNSQDFYVGDIETEAEHFCGYAERREVTT